MTKEQALYWDGYSETEVENVTDRDNVAKALKDALDEWNLGADETLSELENKVVIEAYDFFDTVGYINTEIILAMIAQL